MFIIIIIIILIINQHKHSRHALVHRYHMQTYGLIQWLMHISKPAFNQLFSTVTPVYA